MPATIGSGVSVVCARFQDGTRGADESVAEFCCNTARFGLDQIRRPDHWRTDQFRVWNHKEIRRKEISRYQDQESTSGSMACCWIIPVIMIQHDCPTGQHGQPGPPEPSSFRMTQLYFMPFHNICCLCATASHSLAQQQNWCSFIYDSRNGM